MGGIAFKRTLTPRHRCTYIALCRPVPHSPFTILYSPLLNLHQLSEQFADFSAYQVAEEERHRQKLRWAQEALEECHDAWEALRERVAREKPRRLLAGLREAPGTAYPQGERPTPVTVVATDGSQVYPDRHIEPTCYLLNISQIAFQYGTLERPVLTAEPHFRYRQRDLQGHFDEVLGQMTAEVVSALRDEEELRALLRISRRAKTEGRPLVAMADGTLIRWMIRGMRNHALEQELIRRYTEVLAAFQRERIPLCSYISMPANAELVNLLCLHRDEDEATPPEKSLQGLVDRALLLKTLRPGERSATFGSGSHIQSEYGEGDRICYFYVRVPARSGPGEVGRVEVPSWVAEDAALLDLIHAVVLSECDKGDGYPMILAEAHERAVIRAREKEVFYQLIERQLEGAGLRMGHSQKAASKRRPVV